MAMPALEPIALKHRALFEGFAKRFPPEISEHTFANLYMWRNARPISLLNSGDSLVVTADDGRRLVIFGPSLGPVPLDAAISLVEEAAGRPVAAVERATVDLASSGRRAGWRACEDRANSDYVYRREDLAELAGRRYHAKRNLIAQFKAENSWSYETISASNLNEAAEMAKRWCIERRCDADRMLCAEYVAIQEAFENYDALGLIGAAVRIEGKIEAFTIGGELNARTAVIHFEKATARFKGLYQLIDQEFCRHSLSGYEYVNREQDLGVEGMRRAKESYFPDHMVIKHLIARAGEAPAIGAAEQRPFPERCKIPCD